MSAAVEYVRALLVDGLDIVLIRVSEPHLSLLAGSGLLDHTDIQLTDLDPDDLGGRMVVLTHTQRLETVIPSL